MAQGLAQVSLVILHHCMPNTMQNEDMIKKKNMQLHKHNIVAQVQMMKSIIIWCQEKFSLNNSECFIWAEKKIQLKLKLKKI